MEKLKGKQGIAGGQTRRDRPHRKGDVDLMDRRDFLKKTVAAGIATAAYRVAGADEINPFDTILFPFNYTCYHQANFGPQVMARARDQGMGILALKAMARQRWPEGADRKEFPKPGYQPTSHPKELELALRFTLSEPITAAIPPGDERLFSQALRVAQDFQPLNQEERIELKGLSEGLKPIFPGF